MRFFAVLTIAAMFLLGMAEGDCTAAVAMLVIFAPGIFKRSHRKKQYRRIVFRWDGAASRATAIKRKRRVF